MSENNTANSQDVLHLTDENFQTEVLDFDGVCLVDFWAEWCGPCRMVAPTILKLAEKYADNDKVKICKLNIEEANTSADQFRILSIPTIMTFAKGQQNEMVVGVQQIAKLDQMIDNALKALQ